MARRKHAVQFQHLTQSGRVDSAGLLIEQLRYAGLVHVVSEKEMEQDEHDKRRGGYRVAYLLQIRCPHGLNDAVWANQNRARMASFGINAADVLVD